MMVHNANILGMSYGQYIAKYHPVNFLHNQVSEEPAPKKPRMRYYPVIATCIKTGEVRYYKSGKEAVKKDGFTSSGISFCLKGVTSQHHGWIFRKATEEEIEKMG